MKWQSAQPAEVRCSRALLAGRFVKLRTFTNDGMTLIELMVVLVVLSILASLTLGGLLVARGNAKIAKTSSTIRKLNEVILPYYEEYESRRPMLPDVSPLLALKGGRGFYNDLRQLAIRRLMTMELPERSSDVADVFNEANGTFNPLKSFSKTYVAEATSATVSISDKSPVARRYYSLISGKSVQSGELLHMIVTRGPVADPDMIAHFRADEVSDTDRDGLPEFVDGWQRPISFRRWPTGFGSPVQPIDGSVRTIDSLISTNGHRLSPLIYSAGPDGSYDIESMGELRYASFDYDPFRFDPSAPTSIEKSPIACTPPTAVSRSMVLVPVTRASGSPLTFVACRLDGSGKPQVPDLDTGLTANSSAAFQTVGSERDTGSADGDTPNGILESLDNINNHDLLR